jgi:hypothetical protein
LGIVEARLDFRGRIELVNRKPAYHTPNSGSNRTVKAGLAHAISLNQRRDFGKKRQLALGITI